MSNIYTNTTEETLWFIAHNAGDVVHFGALDPLQQVESGQPYLEIFDNESLWTARKVELGVIDA